MARALFLASALSWPGQAQPQSARTSTAPAPAPPQAPSHDVVVTGKPRLSRDRTEDATRVQGQELRDSPRPSVFEVLSQQAADLYVPGRGALHGVAHGATGALHIRGLGGSPNSQVLVVEDGVPDYQGVFGHPIPDAYAPFLLDEALIVKGGDSVLYGTNAMGGVIVLRSRWRAQEGYELLNDAAYGSYATLRESASFLGRLGSWDLATGWHTLSTDGHRAGAGGKQAVGVAAVRHRFSRTLSLTARSKLVHVGGGDPGPVSHPYLDHWFDVWRNTSSLRMEWRTEALRWVMTPYANLGVHRLYDGFYSADQVCGYDTHLQWTLDPAMDLLGGIGAEHVGGHVENRVAAEHPVVESPTSVFVYGQLTLRPHRRLSLVLGAREHGSSKYGSVFLYKAGARWSLGKGLYLRAHTSRNFRQPTLRELYLPYPTANPDLRPERSLNSDAGGGFASRHFTLSCSAYRTEADDLIKYFGAWPSAEVVNLDHVVIWGIEGTAAVRHLGPVSLLVTGDRQDVGRYTRQNPDTKVNVTLDLQHQFGPDFLSGSLSGEWVHGLFMADYGRQPLDDVFVLDLAVRYAHRSLDRALRLEPYLLLRNLLDSRYAYVEGYRMPGFNLLAGLRIGI